MSAPGRRCTVPAVQDNEGSCPPSGKAAKRLARRQARLRTWSRLVAPVGTHIGGASGLLLVL